MKSEERLALLRERDYLLELQAKYGRYVTDLDRDIREITNQLQKRAEKRECTSVSGHKKV